jgi:hypothetical protein
VTLAGTIVTVQMSAFLTTFRQFVVHCKNT